jgi:hypothetical protein
MAAGFCETLDDLPTVDALLAEVRGVLAGARGQTAGGDAPARRLSTDLQRPPLGN